MSDAILVYPNGIVHPLYKRKNYQSKYVCTIKDEVIQHHDLDDKSSNCAMGLDMLLGYTDRLILYTRDLINSLFKHYTWLVRKYMGNDISKEEEDIMVFYVTANMQHNFKFPFSLELRKGSKPVRSLNEKEQLVIRCILTNYGASIVSSVFYEFRHNVLPRALDYCMDILEESPDLLGLNEIEADTKVKAYEALLDYYSVNNGNL